MDSQSKGDKLVLKRRLPFSLRRVIPFTIWFTLILAFAIGILVEHDKPKLLPCVLLPYLAWCILGLYDAILFHFTKQETTGRIVNSNKYMYLDDGDECYKYFLDIEFIPGHRYLDSSVILNAEVGLSYASQGDIKVIYAKSKPHLALIGKENFAPIRKRKKKGANSFWKILERNESYVVTTFFSSFFALLGGVAFIFGTEILASNSPLELSNFIFLVIGIIFNTASFLIPLHR